jgi:hypothetical protein
VLIRSSVVGSGTMLHERSGVEFPINSMIFFFNLPSLSILTMVLGVTQPLAETSTRNVPGGKVRPVRETDNLIVICEPFV